MLGRFLKVSARKTPRIKVFGSLPGGIQYENLLGGFLEVFGSFPEESVRKTHWDVVLKVFDSFPCGIRQGNSFGICWEGF